MIKLYDRKKILVYNIIFIFIVLFLFIMPNKDTIKTITDSDVHFNIFTAISIFCGFLFTGLSILISSSDRWAYKELNKANRIDKIYFAISIGIIFGCISMIISLFFAFEIIKDTNFIIFELIFLLLTIFNFILSLFYLMKIINILNNFQE